jgi:hypothetical protein
MKNISCLKRLLIMILIFGAILLGGFLLWFYFSPTYSTLSPGESALNDTRELLSAIATKSVGPMPDDLPGYIRVNDDCWKFLQEGMKNNANQYKLTITSEYDSRNDSHAVHQLTEVWLNIEFPDGQIAQMFSMQGGLSFCHKK